MIIIVNKKVCILLVLITYNYLSIDTALCTRRLDPASTALRDPHPLLCSRNTLILVYGLFNDGVCSSYRIG